MTTATVISLDDRRRTTSESDDDDACCFSCSVLAIAARLDEVDSLLVPVDVLTSAAAALRAEVDRAQQRAEQLAREQAQRDQETSR